MVLQTGEIVTASRFFFFFGTKNSISYLCFYIVSFCTFVFIAKRVLSKDLFHWCMPSCIANEIREYQKTNNCRPYLVHTIQKPCLAYTIINQLLRRKIKGTRRKGNNGLTVVC